jgi:ActR/RegA family two-component response regulator
MTSPTRVLFVDDEANIRTTLPRILEMHGFQVTTKSTVAEALAAINSETFEILLTDLNIGQPGDGFTVVSAMRRTQPEAVTMILTGYPAFETALEAIRKQVDHYIVKPAKIEELVRVMREHLGTRQAHRPEPLKRVAVILEKDREQIVEHWLTEVKSDPDLGAVPLEDGERVDHLPIVLGAIIDTLATGSDKLGPNVTRAAIAHGERRRSQGYVLPMVMNEARILRNALYECLQQNLLGIDISYLLPDMAKVNETLDTLVELSLQSFISHDAEPVPEMRKEPKRDYGT